LRITIECSSVLSMRTWVAFEASNWAGKCPRERIIRPGRELSDPERIIRLHSRSISCCTHFLVPFLLAKLSLSFLRCLDEVAESARSSTTQSCPSRSRTAPRTSWTPASTPGTESSGTRGSSATLSSAREDWKPRK